MRRPRFPINRQSGDPEVIEYQKNTKITPGQFVDILNRSGVAKGSQ
jgi:hypothetical protein